MDRRQLGDADVTPDDQAFRWPRPCGRLRWQLDRLLSESRRGSPARGSLGGVARSVTAWPGSLAALVSLRAGSRKKVLDLLDRTDLQHKRHP